MLPIVAVLSTQIIFFHLAPSIFATPLQPGLPTLFNSALRNASTLQITNPAFPNNEYSCFNPEPGHLPTNILDCQSASFEILKGRRVTWDYTFSRGDRGNFKLPAFFRSGTCLISLDMLYDDQMDRLTVLEVQETALNLALRCTNSPDFKTGGIVAMGPKNVLYITIIGVQAPDSS